LLLPENERLLDMIPDSAIVTLITNMNVDLDKNKIFRKLAQRTKVGWSMSFDNVGERFEYVRYGGVWNQIERNIKTIQACAGHRLGIHPLYNIYNATRLSELISWAQGANVPVHWQSLYHPAYLDPLQLGPDVRQLALKELQKVLSNHKLDHGQRNFLQETEARHQQASNDVLTEFINHIGEIESKYHASAAGRFEQLWPELANLL
jgi:hypothetical protein